VEEPAEVQVGDPRGEAGVHDREVERVLDRIDADRGALQELGEGRGVADVNPFGADSPRGSGTSRGFPGEFLIEIGDDDRVELVTRG